MPLLDVVPELEPLFELGAASVVPPLVSLVDPAPSAFGALSVFAPSSPELVAAPAAGRDDVLRSFLAQPLPLKWIVGALNALRTGPAPHTGQASGPLPLTEWMTSNR